MDFGNGDRQLPPYFETGSSLIDLPLFPMRVRLSLRRVFLIMSAACSFAAAGAGIAWLVSTDQFVFSLFLLLPGFVIVAGLLIMFFFVFPDWKNICRSKGDSARELLMGRVEYDNE